MNTLALFDPALFDGLHTIMADLNPAVVVPLVAIPFPFLFVIAIVGMTLLKEYRMRKLQQETIRLMVEKGQPVPPEMLKNMEHKKRRDDRRNGLILIAVGVALFFFFNEGITSASNNGDELCWIGLIPGLIGVAMLLNWALERMDKTRNSGKEDTD